MPRPDHATLEPLLQRGYRYALSLTHDAARAEDLLHDAVVSLLKKRKLDEIPYLIATIRNRFVDLYRRDRLVVMHPLDDMAEQAVDAADSPVDEEYLEEALGTLRPPEREAIYLASVAGYTAQEIADLTGRPRGTVLSMIHRARRKLRLFMEDKGQAPHDREAHARRCNRRSRNTIAARRCDRRSLRNSPPSRRRAGSAGSCRPRWPRSCSSP